RAVECMHVIAAPASQTMAAGHQRMTDDAVADLDAFDAGPDGLHPSGILMAHNVRKLDVNLAAPDALDDMQISAADARAADAHDNVHRAGDLGVGHILVSDELLRRQLFIECMENRSLHSSPPKNFLFELVVPTLRSQKVSKSCAKALTS